MTVFAFDEGEQENPLGRTTAEDAARIPYGAVELDRDGKVLAYNDTEPGEGVGGRDVVGRDFFAEVARWAGGSMIADEFRKGVASNELNSVFDCGVARLPYKVRVHLKVSPILGTYWVFIKKLLKA